MGLQVPWNQEAISSTRRMEEVDQVRATNAKTRGATKSQIKAMRSGRRICTIFRYACVGGGQREGMHGLHFWPAALGGGLLECFTQLQMIGLPTSAKDAALPG